MTQQRRVQIRQRVEAETLPGQDIPTRPADSSPVVSKKDDTPSQQAPPVVDDDTEIQMEGVYIISVAARILDMHPQTLRKYERLGLIRPGRTLGMLRLYSTDDIRKLRLIRRLSDEMGLNLSGVEFVLAAVQNLLTMQQRLSARLGPEAGEAVSEELDLLFHSLNLPVDH
jgi:DNA-binding transcriptional MerR regulator